MQRPTTQDKFLDLVDQAIFKINDLLARKWKVLESSKLAHHRGLF